MSNEVLENIKSRRSVRTYTERQVSAGDLNLILEAAAYAPSGMNFQTWHFTAIQDAAVLTELNEKIKGAFAKSDDPHLQEPDIAKPIVAITMLRRWSSSPTSLPAGGRLWTAHAPCRIFSLPPSLWASALAGLTNWGRPATTPTCVLSSPVSASPKITVCTAVPPWAMPLRTLP